MAGYMLLTMSIAEGKPGSDSFEINCLNLGKTFAAPIYSFSMTKKQIFDANGDPLWDLGKITKVTQILAPKAKASNPVYQAAGDIRLVEEKPVTMEILKRYLAENLSDYGAFKRDLSQNFAIVKVRHVNTIETEEEEKQYRAQRMYLDFDDDHRNEKLLNKDYRWVHYWRQIPEDILWEKQASYAKTLNEPGKDLYLILRRFTFRNGIRKFWISGMHWL